MDKLNYLQKGRIITIFDKYFKAFLEKERALAGNKLYAFSTNAKRVFLKELIGDELTKKDLELLEEYGIETNNLER